MQDSTTRHSPNCRKAFARLDPTCPRCKELAAGAPRRQWYAARRIEQDRQRVAAIRAHDCRKSGCGPICTAFDW